MDPQDPGQPPRPPPCSRGRPVLDPQDPGQPPRPPPCSRGRRRPDPPGREESAQCALPAAARRSAPSDPLPCRSRPASVEPPRHECSAQRLRAIRRPSGRLRPPRRSHREPARPSDRLFVVAALRVCCVRSSCLARSGRATPRSWRLNHRPLPLGLAGAAAARHSRQRSLPRAWPPMGSRSRRWMGSRPYRGLRRATGVSRSPIPETPWLRPGSSARASPRWPSSSAARPSSGPCPAPSQEVRAGGRLPLVTAPTRLLRDHRTPARRGVRN